MTSLASFLLVLVAGLSALAVPAGARADLPPAWARQLADAGVPADAVGLVVAPVAPGARFVEHAAQRPLQPGSAMKLVTTLVALEQLGPAWRGHTRLLAAGPIRDGVLHGDLVLQGGADMDLTCLPACVTAEQPLAYEPITAGEYLNERLREIGLKK